MPLQVREALRGGACVCEWGGRVGGVGGRGLAGEGPRRQHLGFASFRLLPLDSRHVGEKAEDGVTDLMSLRGDGDQGERPERLGRGKHPTDGRARLSGLPPSFGFPLRWLGGGGPRLCSTNFTAGFSR